MSPSDCTDRCQDPQNPAGYWGCVSWYDSYKKYDKSGNFKFLLDNGQWNHYSMSFVTTNNLIRIALGDYKYGNGAEDGIAGDCYFANILLTDLNGPDYFNATQSVEHFQAISVNALNKVADAVSYAESVSAVKIDLSKEKGNGGFAEGDTFKNIKTIFGSKYNDILIGDASSNTLNGYEGDDTLEAGEGSDILTGGLGKDSFVITALISTATITDFNVTNEKIDIRAHKSFTTLESIKNAASDSDNAVSINLSDNRTLILLNIRLEDLQGSNFCFYNTTSACSITLAFSPSQQTNSNKQPIISGESLNANDINCPITINLYNSTSNSINICGNCLTDSSNINCITTISSSESKAIVKIIGTKYDDIIIGNDKDNIIWGAGGNDRITGGPGSDTFTIDAGTSSKVTTITDFEINNPLEKISFLEFKCNIKSFKDLVIKGMNGKAEISFVPQTNQINKVLLENIIPSEFTTENSDNNFIFSKDCAPSYSHNLECISSYIAIAILLFEAIFLD